MSNTSLASANAISSCAKELPHLLVMTATPIPRTLGLTLYGDLDCSVIDELLKVAGTICTYIRTPDRWPKIPEFMKEQLNASRQAYGVPRVDNEDTAAGIKAVTKEARKLAEQLLRTSRVLHGRMKLEEKEQATGAFNENRLQVLLSTTVVEVGVDVPNANLMLIQNADRFGLAQLHQLRDGIGRGVHDSHCILLTTGKSDEANDRLKVLEKTNDGFQVAEADLKLRGPGELTGHDQSGFRLQVWRPPPRPRSHRTGPHIASEIEAGNQVYFRDRLSACPNTGKTPMSWTRHGEHLRHGYIIAMSHFTGARSAA